MKSALNIYKPIDKFNIRNLIPVYIKISKLTNEEKKQINAFDQIRVYGNFASPMYSLKDIAIVLGIKKPISETKNFRTNEKEEAIIIPADGTTGVKIKTLLLSQKGLLRLILTTNTDTGELLLNCFSFILDSLFTKKYVTMDDVEIFVKSEHLELYKKVVGTLKKNCRKLRHKNEILLDRIEFVVEREKNTEQQLKQTQYSLENAIRNQIGSEQKLKMLERDYYKLELEADVNVYYVQKQEANRLIKRYTKPIHISLERISSVIKKIDTADIVYDENTFLSKIGIDNYDITDYISSFSGKTKSICPEVDDNKLYNISKIRSRSKSSIVVHTLYGSNDNIFHELKKIMYESYTNDILGKNVLLCSIDDITFEFNDIKLKLS